MDKFAEVQIFPKVSKSYEDIMAAIDTLGNLSRENTSFNSADYYRARNFLKSAEDLLVNDEIMKAWLREEEIELFLQRHFQTQQEGKRKLENIKVRIVLDKLQELITQAKDLQKKAFEKQRSSG
jgi:hypothetical protein